MPINPHTGRRASVSKPSQWGTYAEATAFARSNKLPGVGFVLTKGGGITGADLDDVRDAGTGELKPWAADIIALAETYVEISPSGKGLRILWEGEIAEALVNLLLGRGLLLRPVLDPHRVAPPRNAGRYLARAANRSGAACPRRRREIQIDDE